MFLNDAKHLHFNYCIYNVWCCSHLLDIFYLQSDWGPSGSQHHTQQTEAKFCCKSLQNPLKNGLTLETLLGLRVIEYTYKNMSNLRHDVIDVDVTRSRRKEDVNSSFVCSLASVGDVNPSFKTMLGSQLKIRRTPANILVCKNYCIQFRTLSADCVNI